MNHIIHVCEVVRLTHVGVVIQLADSTTILVIN